MTGAIAAFMSTLDSQLLALSTMTTRDIIQPALGSESMNFKKEVTVGKVIVGLYALSGLMMAFFPFDTIFEMGKMAFTGLAALYPIAYFTIRKHKFQSSWAVGVIFISLFLLVGFHYSFIPQTLNLGFENFVIILLFGFILLALSGLLSKK